MLVVSLAASRRKRILLMLSISVHMLEIMMNWLDLGRNLYLQQGECVEKRHLVDLWKDGWTEEPGQTHLVTWIYRHQYFAIRAPPCCGLCMLVLLRKETLRWWVASGVCRRNKTGSKVMKKCFLDHGRFVIVQYVAYQHRHHVTVLVDENCFLFFESCIF